MTSWRKSDGTTVKSEEADAEMYDPTAKAKRVLLIDDSGSKINSSNPLPVAAILENYQYMGSQTSGNYTYYGFKQYKGTSWYIMRKDSTDDSAWAYAYSSVGGNDFVTAWATPTGESYGSPPDS